MRRALHNHLQQEPYEAPLLHTYTLDTVLIAMKHHDHIPFKWKTFHFNR